MPEAGLKAELVKVAAAEGVAEPADEVAQMLLELGDMPSPVAMAMEDRGVQPRGHGQRGKGRKTLDVVKLIKATKRPTLLAIKELVDLPLPDLAKLLGCTLVEAFDRWRPLAELMAAYEEGKPVQRVELDVEETVRHVVFTSEPVRPDLVNGNPPLDGEYEVIQGVSHGDQGEVYQSKSTIQPIALDYQELEGSRPAD